MRTTKIRSIVSPTMSLCSYLVPIDYILAQTFEPLTSFYTNFVYVKHEHAT